jgi:hypothetical protein
MDLERIVCLYHPNYFEKFNKETITASLVE